jgi:hypothetical protein
MGEGTARGGFNGLNTGSASDGAMTFGGLKIESKIRRIQVYPTKSNHSGKSKPE